MTARCQACEANVATVLSSPIGAQGDPLGACITCQSFACGSHGCRDGYVPEFVCVECDPVRFVTSAAVATEETLAGTYSELDERDAARILVGAVAAGRDDWRSREEDRRFRSIEELWARRPGYDDLLHDADLSRAYAHTLPDLAAVLVLVAARLTQRLYAERSEYALGALDPTGVLALAAQLDLT